MIPTTYFTVAAPPGTLDEVHDARKLVDVAQELATNILATRLLVVKDTRGCRLGKRHELATETRPKLNTYEDDDAERTGREQQVDPSLDLVNLHVVTG